MVNKKYCAVCYKEITKELSYMSGKILCDMGLNDIIPKLCSRKCVASYENWIETRVSNERV